MGARRPPDRDRATGPVTFTVTGPVGFALRQDALSGSLRARRTSGPGSGAWGAPGGPGRRDEQVDRARSHHRGDHENDQEERHGSNSGTVEIVPLVAGMPLHVDFLPLLRQDGGMSSEQPLQTIAVIVQDHAEPFGLGALVEVWGEPEHPEDRTPVFDFRVCTPRQGRVKGRSDYDLYVERGLEATLDADLLCLAPHHDFLNHDPAVLDAIRAA